MVLLASKSESPSEFSIASSPVTYKALFAMMKLVSCIFFCSVEMLEITVVNDVFPTTVALVSANDLLVVLKTGVLLLFLFLVCVGMSCGQRNDSSLIEKWETIHYSHAPVIDNHVLTLLGTSLSGKRI